MKSFEVDNFLQVMSSQVEAVSCDFTTVELILLKEQEQSHRTTKHGYTSSTGDSDICP